MFSVGVPHVEYIVDTTCPRIHRNRTALMIVDEYSRIRAVTTAQRYNEGNLVKQVYLQERTNVIKYLICNKRSKCIVKVQGFFEACTEAVPTCGWGNIKVSEVVSSWEVVRKGAPYAKVQSAHGGTFTSMSAKSDLMYVSFERHGNNPKLLERRAEIVTIKGIKRIDWNSLIPKLREITPIVNQYRSHDILSLENDDTNCSPEKFLEGQRIKKHPLRLPQFNGLLWQLKDASGIWTPRDVIKYICLSARSLTELKHLLSTILPGSTINTYPLLSPENSDKHCPSKLFQMVAFVPELYRPYNSGTWLGMAHINPEVTGLDVVGPLYRAVVNAPFAVLSKSFRLGGSIKSDQRMVIILSLNPPEIQRLEVSKSTLGMIASLEYEAPVGVEGIQADKYALIGLRMHKSEGNVAASPKS